MWLYESSKIDWSTSSSLIFLIGFRLPVCDISESVGQTGNTQRRKNNNLELGTFATVYFNNCNKTNMLWFKTTKPDMFNGHGEK